MGPSSDEYVAQYRVVLSSIGLNTLTDGHPLRTRGSHRHDHAGVRCLNTLTDGHPSSDMTVSGISVSGFRLNTLTDGHPLRTVDGPLSNSW